MRERDDEARRPLAADLVANALGDGLVLAESVVAALFAFGEGADLLVSRQRFLALGKRAGVRVLSVRLHGHPSSRASFFETTP